MGQDPQATGIPAAGDVIAERYQIEDIIGAGGMGVVVAARHVGLGQRFAIKFLFPEMVARPDVVARFMREARAGASIRSEHVARIFDVATLPNGAPYMVMELLAGTDLEKLARDRGPLPIADAIAYVLEACEAVADAHAQGIIHRDLKTANLFLAQRPDGSAIVKVLDFGLSKMVDGVVALTAESATLGSPGFISPEQLRSTKSADHRTDIWAMGVILHRLLAGSMPFDGARIQDCLAKILHEPPPPLRSLRPDVPAELEAVILRCLEKPVERRIQDVAELAVALAPFAPPRSHVSIDRAWKALRGATPLPVIAPIGAHDVAVAAPPAPVSQRSDLALQATEDRSQPAAPWAASPMTIGLEPAPAPAPAPMSAEMRAARRTVPMQRVAPPATPLAVGSTMPMPRDLPPPSATFGSKPASAAPAPRPAAPAPKPRNVLPFVTLAVAVVVIVAGWLATRFLL